MSTKKSLRIVMLSDVHLLYREIPAMPPGDLLLFAGDMMHMGGTRSGIQDFNAWLDALLYAVKVIVPGNHDEILLKDPTSKDLFRNATLLIDECVEVFGLKIWGSPVTPLGLSPFGVGSAADRVKLYQTIPEDVDILLTHTPPFGILDGPPDSDQHAGCPELLQAVIHLRPLLHVFGHVHHGHGILFDGDTTFVNAAILGHGELAHEPVVLDLPAIQIRFLRCALSAAKFLQVTRIISQDFEVASISGVLPRWWVLAIMWATEKREGIGEQPCCAPLADASLYTSANAPLDSAALRSLIEFFRLLDNWDRMLTTGSPARASSAGKAE